MYIKLYFILFYSVGCIYSQKININNDVLMKNGCPISLFFPSQHEKIGYNGIDSCDCIWVDFERQENLKILLYYENGFKTRLIAYYDNGRKFEETSFKELQLHGISKRWYKDGSRESIGIYDNDTLVSPFIVWFNNGIIKTIDDGILEKNKGHTIQFDKSGKIWSETYRIDSTKNGFRRITYNGNYSIIKDELCNIKGGFIRQYFNNKQPASFGYGSIFCKQGHWQDWYENGVLKKDYYYHQSICNQEEGLWRYWDEQGNLIKEETYKNGEKISEKEYVPVKKQNEK